MRVTPAGVTLVMVGEPTQAHHEGLLREITVRRTAVRDNVQQKVLHDITRRRVEIVIYRLRVRHLDWVLTYIDLI